MLTITALFEDDTGFIVSAELVLVATILVLGMLVGMSQVQYAVVGELNDVAHAIGALNQTYYYSGFSAFKYFGFLKSRTVGSAFYDFRDTCDYSCTIACTGAVAEGGYGGYGGGFGGGICGGGCGAVGGGIY